MTDRDKQFTFAIVACLLAILMSSMAIVLYIKIVTDADVEKAQILQDNKTLRTNERWEFLPSKRDK